VTLPSMLTDCAWFPRSGIAKLPDTVAPSALPLATTWPLIETV
jgi:hypothetical protein